MGLFDSLFVPSYFEKDRDKREQNKKSIFDSYKSAEDYAEDHREDHDGWEDAMDAWHSHRRKKIGNK